MAMMSRIEEATMMIDRVFVYGTLKKGQANERFLDGAQFLGNAWTTRNGWNLVDLGAFPAMTYGHSQVKGEVYRVDWDHMQDLDRLESFPDLYTRNVIHVTLDDGSEVSAWAYHMPDMAGSSSAKQLTEWSR